ncbi:MAG: metallophosphoesterase, partial [Clostridia bacterium]|nr:metallophosphoesterase [Clostridia bacterium]
MKRIIATFLSLIVILTSLSLFASAEVIENDAVLQFNADGKFKILHICDIQDTPYTTPQTLDYIARVCDSENPDLIVLGGDNLGSNCGKAATDLIAKWQVKRAINHFMSIFEEREIPTAVVFGNHDGEKQIVDEVQMEMYMSYDCCVAVDEGPDLYGCGTYNIPIMSSDGKNIAYNIWCFDSNDYYEEGYDKVYDDQVEWYVKKSNELKKANNGKIVPSMA